MASVRFRIFRLKDRELLEAFDCIRSDVQDAQQANVRLDFGTGGVPHIDAPLPPIPSADKNLTRVVDADSAVVSSASMSLQNGVSIAVNRQQDNSIDDCAVSYPDNFDPGSYAQLLAACHQHLRAFDRTDSLSRLLGTELSEFYTRREQTLLRLENLTEKLIQQNSEYRREVDRETTDLRLRLQKDMDDARAQLRAEYEAKDADVKAKETALEERIKVLDDRRATHARRQIRADMKQSIDDREKDFSLTERTIAKRRPIHWLFALLIATPAVILAWGLWDLIWHGVRWEGTPYDWLRLVRVPLGAIGLAGVIVYYIRWNDQWFRAHAQEEFRLKRLDLDIDRASWMVEMMLEWKEEKQSPPPPELIDRLSRNLFTTDSRDEDVVRHPAQDLVSALLQASSSITVPIPGGGNATLDAKGLRRFRKKATDGE